MSTPNLSHQKNYAGYCVLCGRNDERIACPVLAEMQINGTDICKYCNDRYADGAMLGHTGEPWLICAGCVESRLRECEGNDEYRCLWTDSNTVESYLTLNNETAYAVYGVNGRFLVTPSRTGVWEVWKSDEIRIRYRSEYVSNAIKRALRLADNRKPQVRCLVCGEIAYKDVMQRGDHYHQ